MIGKSARARVTQLIAPRVIISEQMCGDLARDGGDLARDGGDLARDGGDVPRRRVLMQTSGNRRARAYNLRRSRRPRQLAIVGKKSLYLKSFAYTRNILL